MNRFKSVRKSCGLSQKDVCDALHITQSSVSQWETGRTTPDHDTLIRLSKLYNTPIEYLLGIADKGTSSGVRIPVVGCIQAGIPVEAIEEILDWEEIPESMAHGGEFFGLQIRGDSMEPRIKEGDVVIVRKQETAMSGDVAVVLVNGEDATVKRVIINKSGITLDPFNPAYEPIHYTQHDIETLPVQILGVVVELRGKFK